MEDLFETRTSFLGLFFLFMSVSSTLVLNYYFFGGLE